MERLKAIVFGLILLPLGGVRSEERGSDLIRQWEHVTKDVGGAGVPPCGACSSIPASSDEKAEYLAFVKRWKCSELFSQNPPTWVTQSPDAGFFKDPTNWHPFCSLYELHRLEKSRGKNQDALLPDLRARFLKRDECANHPKQDRFNSEYTPPTQEGLGLRPMNKAELAELKKKYEAVRGPVAKTCCGTDASCIGTMKKVQLFQCQPQTDPKAPDPCLNDGYYQADGAYREWLRWTLAQSEDAEEAEEAKAEFKDQFPIRPGRLVLSAYVNKKTGEYPWFLEDWVFRHELGHACSRIRRSLLIRQGYEEAINEFISSSSCEIGKNTKAVYQYLFKKRGYSDATSGCFVTRSQDAKKGRFGTGSCPKGCERSYLEEFYGDTMVGQSLSPAEYYPSFLPQVCWGAQDSRHGLSADEMRCLVRTPAILEKMKKAVGCTP